MTVTPIVVSTLIAAPLAFVIGWVVSKAYFRSAACRATGDGADGTAKNQSISQTGIVRALKSVVLKHEATYAATRVRLVGLKGKLARKDERVSNIEQELTSLRKHLADRDNTIGRLRRSGNGANLSSADIDSEMIILRAERDEFLSQIEYLEEKLQMLAVDAERDSRAEQLADNDTDDELQQLRETLSSHNSEIFQLRQRLHDRDEREQALRDRLLTWNNRVKPLSQQFRRQRTMIRELRTQLKNRSAATAGVGESGRPLIDDLEQIYGIGPVLRRKLNQQGIYSYQQLAELSDASLACLANQLSIGVRRLDREQWVHQAQQLHQQKYSVGA